MRVLTGALTLTLSLSGCALLPSREQTTPAQPADLAPSSAPAPTTVSPSATPTPTPSAAPVPTLEATPAPTQDGPPPATTDQKRPASGQRMTLSYGQTARLAYFDVTALKQEHGKDGVSIGWKVRVCYRAPHAGAGSDGRTRVSNNPWSVTFRDGEAGGPSTTRAISALPRDRGWQPEFTETRLGLGECQEGWLPVKHDNPDLVWESLTYAPPDFGDRITWR